MSKSILCTASQDQAGQIIQGLKTAGVSQDEISVLMADTAAISKPAEEPETKAHEGAMTGGISGAAVGGVLGLLAGMGSFAIPDLGPLIAAGPLAAAVAGATIVGTLGGIAGAGLGMPESEAKDYEGKIRSGSVLISVRSNDGDEIERAREIFKHAGAEDISTWGEVSGSHLAGACSTELI